jgi:hypothetical protein
MSIDQLEVIRTGNQPSNSEEAGTEGVQAAWQANMELIGKKLDDPKFDVEELMRLVTLQIVLVVQHMLALGFRAEEEHIRSRLGAVVKFLRELGHSLMDNHSLRKKRDVVNWEGQGMKHVVGEMVSWFVDALTEAGIEEWQRNNVMRHYRDLALLREPQLMRETKALEG